MAEYLIKHYPAALKERYGLTSIPDAEFEFMEMMGARHGCISAGIRIDLEKASAILVHEFRAGILGQITLETPDMTLQADVFIEPQRQYKTAKDEERKRKFRSGRRDNQVSLDNSTHPTRYLNWFGLFGPADLTAR